MQTLNNIDYLKKPKNIYIFLRNSGWHSNRIMYNKSINRI